MWRLGEPGAESLALRFRSRILAVAQSSRKPQLSADRVAIGLHSGQRAGLDLSVRLDILCRQRRTSITVHDPKCRVLGRIASAFTAATAGRIRPEWANSFLTTSCDERSVPRHGFLARDSLSRDVKRYGLYTF